MVLSKVDKPPTGKKVCCLSGMYLLVACPVSQEHHHHLSSKHPLHDTIQLLIALYVSVNEWYKQPAYTLLIML